jgi:hypothetical protein
VRPHFSLNPLGGPHMTSKLACAALAVALFSCNPNPARR